jgi:hypothetical protein
VQIALGPPRQFAPLELPLAPKAKGLAELGENARTMIIYHCLMRASGHFHLQKLTYRT